MRGSRCRWSLYGTWLELSFQGQGRLPFNCWCRSTVGPRLPVCGSSRGVSCPVIYHRYHYPQIHYHKALTHAFSMGAALVSEAVGIDGNFPARRVCRSRSPGWPYTVVSLCCIKRHPVRPHMLPSCSSYSCLAHRLLLRTSRCCRWSTK
jgi:hypothetical protein